MKYWFVSLLLLLAVASAACTLTFGKETYYPTETITADISVHQVLGLK
jgi:hypothetical protein